MTQAVQQHPSIEPRFESGDPVVHPHQGAGTVEKIITIQRNGEPRLYYSIELVGGESKLMMPIEKAEELGLRKADFGMDDIQSTLENEPEELADNYRSRHSTVRARIGSGEPVELARVVRDMTWRGRQPDIDLTKVDKDLLREAKKMLGTEVAARTDTTLNTAMRKINQTIRDAMDQHLSENGK